jgi:hypothetical protein
MSLEFGHPDGEALVFCGLAGGLHEHLPTGTVVIPNDVRRPDGSVMRCDDELSEALVAGARKLGLEPVVAAMLTSRSVVVGAERATWSREGFAAADMETGLLRAPRVAAVRVILDTPARELSSDWLNPALAFLKPWNWPQAAWLAREGPRCARLAARVIASAFTRSAG